MHGLLAKSHTKKKGGGEGASHLVRLVRVHLKEGEEIA